MRTRPAARIRQRRGGEIEETAPTAEVQRAIARIVDLLAGKRDDLTDIPLDLDDVPEFNRGVYDIARKIPPGQTMTYGDIAKRLAASSCRATSARRSGATRARSWCRATAYWRPATSPAASPRAAASTRN